MAKIRIVVIDDCTFTLQILKDMITELGIHVDLAKSGAEANRFIYHVPQPDLVLMDIEMPATSGDEKVRLLKKTPGFKNIPVILMSAKTNDEMEHICLLSGADGYSIKPVTAEQLKDKLNYVLQMDFSLCN